MKISACSLTPSVGDLILLDIVLVCSQALLWFVKSIHTFVHFPFFFLIIVMLEIHSGYWTSVMNPTSSRWFTSLLMILFLLGANLLCFCCIDFTLRSVVSWCSYISPTIDVMWCDEPVNPKYEPYRWPMVPLTGISYPWHYENEA